MSIVTLKKFKKTGFLPAGIPTFSDTATTFSVDLDGTSNGSRKKVLTKEEAAYFAPLLNRTIEELDNPNSEFWRDYIFVMRGSSTDIDDSKPDNKLALKVLAADSRVISSDEDRAKKSKAEYILENVDEISTKNVERRNTKVEAFTLFAKMSEEDLKEAILMYNKNPRDLTSLRIKEIVGNELEANPKKFLDIVTDKHYRDKVFINDLIQERLIKLSGTGFVYDGEMIAHDKGAMLQFVKDPRNTNVIISMKKSLNDKKGSKEYTV